MNAKRAGALFLVPVGAALALYCAERPPPRAGGEFFGVAQFAPLPNAGAANVAEATRASGSSGVHYPGETSAPPPVPPPEGQGNSVRLQKQIVVDQFGYTPNLAKVAVLARREIGWNTGEPYQPGKVLEVKKWSDGTTVFKGPATPWNRGTGIRICLYLHHPMTVTYIPDDHQRAALALV